jgi:hypothetical protein
MHGPDKLRYDHLRILVGYGNEENSDETFFADKLAEIIKLLVDCKAPSTVYNFLRDNEIKAIPKGDDDVRPIGLGGVIRKLCSIFCLEVTTLHMSNGISFNDNHFNDLQFGVDRKQGCEKIIHSFRYSNDDHPEKDVFCMDAANAYNTANRLFGLNEVKKHLPTLLPFLRSMYGTNSQGWFYGLEEGLQIVPSQEGFHQGDVMGSWLYCMTIQPFLQQLRDILGKDGFVKFFIDDGNVTGPFDVMVKAVEFIIREGPKYGYHLKMDKGTYLLGRCDHETAIKRKTILINLGLSDNIIILHPDDEPSTKGEYGVLALGSFIGSDKFIRAKLAKKLASLEDDAHKIKLLDNHQLKNLLLRLCFSQTPIYLQRTVPPRLMNSHFIKAFDDMKRSILCSIIERDSIPDRQWTQACLPITSGGLGYSFSSDVSYAAFIASFHECLPHLDDLINDGDNLNSKCQVIKDLEDAISFVSKSADDFNLEYLSSVVIPKDESLQHFISHIMTEKREEHFFKSLSDNNEKAWIVSLKHKECSAWLEAIPKNSYLSMNSDQFSTAMSLRLYHNQKDLLMGTKCTCTVAKSHPMIDPQCIHLCTGCRMDGTRIRTHNNVRDSFNAMLNHCGIKTIVEEKNCFKAADPYNGEKLDISAINLPGYAMKQLLDIRITSPCPTDGKSTLTLNQALNPLRAANHSFQEKKRKYEKNAFANNLGCLPIVFEVTGAMHPNVLNLIEKVTRTRCKTLHCSFNNLSKYWLSVISITLQSSLSAGIMTRLSNIYSGQHNRSYQTSENFIQDFSYAAGLGGARM